MPPLLSLVIFLCLSCTLYPLNCKQALQPVSAFDPRKKLLTYLIAGDGFRAMPSLITGLSPLVFIIICYEIFVFDLNEELDPARSYFIALLDFI